MPPALLDLSHLWGLWRDSEKKTYKIVNIDMYKSIPLLASWDFPVLLREVGQQVLNESRWSGSIWFVFKITIPMPKRIKIIYYSCKKKNSPSCWQQLDKARTLSLIWSRESLSATKSITAQVLNIFGELSFFPTTFQPPSRTFWMFVQRNVS